MKILLATYSAACHGSYGIVTRELWRRLAKMNPSWTILQHGWFHHGNYEQVPWPIEPTARIKDEKGRTRPDPQDRFGALSFESVVKRFRPDIVWTLSDPYMCDYMGQYRLHYGFRLVKHCPADGMPQPPSWKAGLEDCDLLSPITHYAANAFAGLLGYNNEQVEDLHSNVVYHGVDLQRFPSAVPNRNKRTMGADTFMLGFCGIPQFRKQPWLTFLVLRHLLDGAYWVQKDGSLDAVVIPDIYHEETRTFSQHGQIPGFTRGTPMKVGLWAHCRQDETSGTYYSISGLKTLYGVEDAVFKSSLPSANEGVPDEAMREFYNGIDTLMMLSGGEGFGLPVIEAFASDIPVVYTDYGSLAEIGAFGGLRTRPSIIMPQPGTLTGRALADIGHAIANVRHIYLNGFRKTRQIAADTFDLDKIANQWDALLKAKVPTKRLMTIGVTI